MASLCISEYPGLLKTPNDGVAQVTVEPCIADQVLAITGTSAPSAAFNAGTTVIYVCTDADCYIKVGSGTPVATTSNKFLPAGAMIFFGVAAGHKLAVIEKV